MLQDRQVSGPEGAFLPTVVPTGITAGLLLAR